jgi:hypothetical protein
MNNFTIRITAIDNATKSIVAINNSVSKLARPLTELGRSFSRMGSALGIFELKKLGIQAGIAGSAVSIAGFAIYEFMAHWAALGWEINRTAVTLGVSAVTLQQYRGAAHLAGVSTEDLTGGMKTLGDTMQDALMGRNFNAAYMLQRLGVTVHHLADGTIDTVRGFEDLAVAIHAIKSPQVQGLVARTFGLEASLPLMRMSKAERKEFLEFSKRVGATMSEEDTKRVGEFGSSLARLGEQLLGVKNTMAIDFLPTANSLVSTFRSWLDTNRELAATLASGLGLGALVLGIGALSAALLNLALSPGGLWVTALLTGLGSGYVLGALINKFLINPAMEIATGQQGTTLGSWLADKFDNSNTGIGTTSGGKIGGRAYSAPRDAGAFDMSAGLAADRKAWNPSGNKIKSRVEILQQEAFENPDDPMLKKEIANEQKVQVEVIIHNAPTGTTATTRTSGGAIGRARIGHALSGAPG